MIINLSSNIFKKLLCFCWFPFGCTPSVTQISSIKEAILFEVSTPPPPQDLKKKKEKKGSHWSVKYRVNFRSQFCCILDHFCSGITGGAGGRVPPRDFWQGNLCWPTGKKGQGKKVKGVKIQEKRRKIVKGKVENWKWTIEKLQNEERTFLFFFFFFFQKH